MGSQEQVILWIILTCTGLGNKPWQHLPRHSFSWCSSDGIHTTTTGRNPAWGLLHSSISSWSAHILAEERIWDIKYKGKPQTAKSQSISGLTCLSEHLLRKLCYQGRNKKSWLFSVGDLLPSPAPKWVSKKGTFSLFPPLLTLSQNVTLIFQGHRTATWHLRVRPSCFPLGKPQKDKMKRKAESCFTKVTWNTGAAAHGKGTLGLLSHSLCMSAAHWGTKGKNYRKQICL